MKKVAIIGGGVGGLATANLLAKKGFAVTIYESRHQLGGRMGLLEANGFRFDTGPSWYLMPEVFEHYYQILGRDITRELQLVRLQPAYKVFSEAASQPFSISGDEATDAALFDRIEPGAGASLHRYLDSAERAYKLALEHFLYTDFNSLATFRNQAVLRHGLPMLGAASQSLDRFVSRRFKSPIIRQLLEYPAVFLGASPFTTPALFHLMSYLDFRQGVFYPKGGMYSITESLAAIGKELGVTFRLDTPVSRISIEGGKASGVLLGDGTADQADIVISNADLYFTSTSLLPPEYVDYPQKYWDRREAGPSALLIYLGVKGPLPQLEHHNLFFVKDWKNNFEQIFRRQGWPDRASIYVCKPSKTDPTVAPDGSENIFFLVPVPADPSQQPADLSQAADRYIAQVAAEAGIPDLASRISYRKLYGPKDFAEDLNAWNGTALGLSHRLLQSAMFRPTVQSKKVRGLYYVGGNVQPGIGVPMCLISAELAAKAISGIKGPGRMEQL